MYVCMHACMSACMCVNGKYETINILYIDIYAYGHKQRTWRAKNVHTALLNVLNDILDSPGQTPCRTQAYPLGYLDVDSQKEAKDATGKQTCAAL